MARPRAGDVETRELPLEADGRKIRGRIPYGIESRDLGGFTEIIDPAALRNTKLDDLVATVDHAGVPIGRYPTTLDLEDRNDGLHWSVSPPESRADVREAIERGDLRAGSWRMRVKRDSWDGDLRRVHEIAELRDVSIVTAPAYEAALVELRSQPDPATGQEDTMADTAEQNTETATAVETNTEDRSTARRL